MRIKAIYRKNLKMSEGKVAAQVAHAVKNLGLSPHDSSIIVLKVSDKKFFELTKEHDCYIQFDFGFTEVEKGTPTAAAWIEEGKEEIIKPLLTKEQELQIIKDFKEKLLSNKTLAKQVMDDFMNQPHIRERLENEEESEELYISKELADEYSNSEFYKTIHHPDYLKNIDPDGIKFD